MPLTYPRRVGAYHLVHPVGQGGLAEVFMALRNDRPCAVKCLKRERMSEPRFLRDFIREAKISTSLDHPNILRFLDQGKVDDTYFAVMELLVGATLEQLLSEAKNNSDPLPLSFSLFCLAELCKALKFLHRSTVYEHSNSVLFHGDISSTNVMVCQDGRVLLMDFGSAGQQSDTDPKDHHLGKMYYLPPDVLQKAPYTTATDVYSMGVLAFYLLFGSRPFDAGSKVELYQAILENDLPRFDCAGVARTAKDEGPLRIFFNKALHKDPKVRFQTVEEFEQQFLALRFAQPTPQMPSEFLRVFPPWLTARFSATAREWVKQLQSYRDGRTPSVEQSREQGPVESLLAHINRRSHPRLSVGHLKMEAEVLAAEERVKINAPLVELSQGGMLVRWEGLPARLGGDYPVTLKLGDTSAPIQATGRMIYEVEKKSKPHVAFRFTRILPENELLLAEYVSTHLPAAPSAVIAAPEASETYVDVIFPSVAAFQGEFETNIGHGGMFIQSTRPFAIDETILLRIQIGNLLERITLKGAVVQCKPLASAGAPNARFGVGLQLADPPARIAELFGRLLPTTH
ncbi:MAG: protein kinase [Pseudomonadota bacterium]